MGKGGGTKVVQSPTLNADQARLAKSIMEMITPQIGVEGPVYAGERYAQVAPEYLSAATGAMQNLTGGIEQAFAPAYEYAARLWEDVVRPGVMQPFASLGAAASGGAAQALSRAGERLALGLGTEIAPLWLQAQGQVPRLAQQIGGWEQATRQQELDVMRERWAEEQPYMNPYLNLVPMVLPYGAPAFENIAYNQPASLGYSMMTAMAPGIGQVLPWGAIGGGLWSGLSGIGSAIGGALGALPL